MLAKSKLNSIETVISQALHGAKNHISQVVEYHRKLKKTMQISSFHQLFG